MIKFDANRRSGHERRLETANTLEKAAHTASRVSRLVVFCLLLELLLVVYVFVTEHDGRQKAVSAVRAGCEQDKKDRIASVILNNDIVGVFHEAQKYNSKLVSPARNRILKDIQTTTNGLESRSKIDCIKRYPAASWFP